MPIKQARRCGLRFSTVFRLLLAYFYAGNTDAALRCVGSALFYSLSAVRRPGRRGCKYALAEEGGHPGSIQPSAAPPALSGERSLSLSRSLHPSISLGGCAWSRAQCLQGRVFDSLNRKSNGVERGRVREREGERVRVAPVPARGRCDVITTNDVFICSFVSIFQTRAAGL